MSQTKETMIDDIELFEQIHKEEMKEVPSRQNLQSQVVSQKALGPAIVKFINHKLMNQGTKNARSNKRTNKKEQDEFTSDS